MKKPDNTIKRNWELSYFIEATEEEALAIYDAFQVLLCTCQHDKDHCRVPVSGMHPPMLIPED